MTSLQGIDWMPSPPLVPDDAPLDLTHLDRMTFGNSVLEHEVLALFAAQSARLMARLATHPAETAALAHQIKGSAAAIGAHAAAEAADALATAPDDRCALRDLKDAIAAVGAAIDARLMRC